MEECAQDVCKMEISGARQSTRGKYHYVLAMLLYFPCRHLLLATARNVLVL